MGPETGTAGVYVLEGEQGKGGLRFEEYPESMWVFDRGTLRFLAVNDATVRRYGYSREEFLSMTIEDIRPAEAVPILMKYYRNISLRIASGVDEAGVLRERSKEGVFFALWGLGQPRAVQR